MKLINIRFEKEKLENVPGCFGSILIILPFVLLLITLHTLEPFIFWGVDDTPFHFTLFATFAIVSYVFLSLFFAIAKKWQRWVMYIYIAILVLQTGVGFIYKYYRPQGQSFSNEEMNSINHYISSDKDLPKGLSVLIWNDSIGVIGKSVDYLYANCRTNYNKLEITNTVKRGYTLSKFSPKEDFIHYRNLISGSKGNKKEIPIFYDFWQWQFPDRLIYIYKELQLYFGS
ncbi:hypothetical protein [Saccharicrinis fermentans]|uniref:Uncharacterized protein n=1 Tax=Saccharicrinis fermentans DSM 9555 = JCM 21142 TaxID=869213 RepID=W7Y6M8_9BACT|nr:hypothetical protein [Saccharicrinis fermentans]GAF03298.1 hypothetical protein JCM21142_41966 [Saccharicrinis fermentans DSM 9555 = JCM 21142]